MVDDFGAGRGTNGRAVVGVPVAGEIEVASDRDFFRVVLEEGRFYTLDLTGAQFSLLYGTDFTRTVDLVEAYENVKFFSDIAEADELVFASEDAGEYYVAVARASGTEPPAQYSLTVRLLDEAIVTSGSGTSDYIHWQAGQSLVEGTSGNDALSFAFYENVGLSFTFSGEGTGQVNGSGYFFGGNTPLLTRFAGIERITGTSQADRFFSDPFDFRHSEPGVHARGLGGNDLFYLGVGRDFADGGGGADTVSYAYSNASGVTASLFAGRGWAGVAEGDRFRNIEHLIGNARADFLTGDHSNNRLNGMANNDTIMGNGGSDFIDGGQGVDVAVYSGDRGDYYISDAPQISRSNPGGSFQVEGIHVSDQRFGGGDGFDTLYGVEVLRFADGDLFL